MTLAAGTKLGPYEIIAPLGAGDVGSQDGADYLVMECVEGEWPLNGRVFTSSGA